MVQLSQVNICSVSHSRSKSTGQDVCSCLQIKLKKADFSKRGCCCSESVAPVLSSRLLSGSVWPSALPLIQGRGYCCMQDLISAQINAKLGGAIMKPKVKNKNTINIKYIHIS